MEMILESSDMVFIGVAKRNPSTNRRPSGSRVSRSRNNDITFGVSSSTQSAA